MSPRRALALAVVLALSGARASAGAEPLAFDQALARIVERSTGIANQQAVTHATRARGVPARLAFAPSVSFDAQTKYYGPNVNPYTPPDLMVNLAQAELTSQLNLFHWGADYEALRAAEADEDSQQALLDAAVLKAEDDGAKALFTEVEALQEVEILQGLVRTQEESYAVARQRYGAGLLPLQESDKVAVDLANARARLADAQVREAASLSALENLLGDARVRAEWPWKTTLPGARAMAEEPRSDAELARTLSARPDWRAAELRVQAEEQRTSQAWRLLGPSVDANGSYGYYGQTGVPNTSGWSVGLTVTLPFFDHLQTVSNARAQGYVRESAESTLEQTRRDARSDWESARRSFGVALDSALSREKTLSLSRGIYEDNLKRFRAGRTDANELALDEGRVSDSELFAAQGWNTAHLAYLRLCHARGLRLSECSALHLH